MPAIQQSGSTNYNKTSIASTRIFLKDSPTCQQNSSLSITKSIGSRKSSGNSNNTTSHIHVNLQKPSTRTSSTKPSTVYAVRSTLYYNLSAQLPPYSNVVLQYRRSSSIVDIPLRLTLSTTRAFLRVTTKTPAKTATTRKLPITLVALEVVSWILSKSSTRKSVSSTLYIRTPTTQASQQIERTLSILIYIASLIVLISLQRILLYVITRNVRFLVYSRPYQEALQLYSRLTSLQQNAIYSFVGQALNIFCKNYIHASIPIQVQLPVVSITVQLP